VRKAVASLLLSVLVCTLFPRPAAAVEVEVPAGTTVYCRLDERVTSKKKETQVGDIVRASVWRDVVVDGAIVIKAGTPVRAHVAKRRSAKIAGVQGKLEIAADNVALVDGEEVRLEGGYDKRGRGRKAVSITLAAVLLWPLIFIKGKQAILEEGTVFDSYTLYARKVGLDEGVKPRRAIRLTPDEFVSVEILYDEMEANPKTKVLPMMLTVCGWGDQMPELRIDVVNGEEISPAFAVTTSDASYEEHCLNARGEVQLKPLGKVFRRGMNTFEVAADLEDRRIHEEILLEIEF